MADGRNRLSPRDETTNTRRMTSLISYISRREQLKDHSLSDCFQAVGRTICALLVLASMLLVFTVEPARAASSGSSLDKLENRFFEHTYKSDSEEARIDRLEKLVFGEIKQGDLKERLSSLESALPKDDTPQTNSAAAPTSDDGTGSSSAASNSPSADDDDAPSDGTDYPSVDALEQLILGKQFRNEGLGRRLSQLEVKAYGKRSDSSDMSERVQKLSDYVQKHYHKSISQLTDPRNIYHYDSPVDPSTNNVRSPGYASAPSYGSGSSGSYGMAPPISSGRVSHSEAIPNDAPPPPTAPEAEQIAWLEAHVFGRTSPQAPLLERIAKLDQAVFPSEPPNQTASIAMQIRVLVNAVELMHNSNRDADGQATAYRGGSAQPNAGNSNFPSWPPQGQSSAYSAPQYAAAPQQNATYQGAYTPQQTTTQQQPAQANSQKTKHGHPLLKSLAKTLLTVGEMAAGSAMGGYGYGGGYGGYGGMGGYGGYGGYGSGYGYGRGIGMGW